MSHNSDRTGYAARCEPLMLAATLWVYHRLIMVQPPEFRRAFGDSITQVFRQTCLDAYRSNGNLGLARLWLPALSDVLSGALAEYAALLAHALKGSLPVLQLRRSASVIFAAFIAFVLAGIAFDKMSEDIMKSSLPATYPLLSITYDAMVVGSVIALLAVLAGGIPVALASLRYALAHRRYDILARFAVPPVALIVFLVVARVVFILNLGGNTPATIHSPQRIATVGGLALLFVLCAIVSTYAVLSAIARSDIDERLLRFTLLPGALATVAMLAMVAAHILWSFGLWLDAPTHFWGNDGILATSTLAGTVVQVLIMLVATLIAFRALVWGVSARRATPHLA